MGVDMNGLTKQEVVQSRKKYGSNTLTKIKPKSLFQLILESFSDPIIKILLIVLAIKIVFLFRDFDFFETIGILIAIVLASVIGAISEYASEEAFKNWEDRCKSLFSSTHYGGKRIISYNPSYFQEKTLLSYNPGIVIPF